MTKINYLRGVNGTISKALRGRHTYKFSLAVVEDLVEYLRVFNRDFMRTTLEERLNKP